MANYDGFEKASYYGNKGELVALDLLKRNGFTTQYVSTNPNFFTAGDIIATKNNQNYFIEVKTDTTAHKSQNLVIEFTSKQKLTLPGRRCTKSPLTALWGILDRPAISRADWRKL